VKALGILLDRTLSPTMLPALKDAAWSPKIEEALKVLRPSLVR
jgi:hypothetical protein